MISGVNVNPSVGVWFFKSPGLKRPGFWLLSLESELLQKIGAFRVCPSLFRPGRVVQQALCGNLQEGIQLFA